MLHKYLFEIMLSVVLFFAASLLVYGLYDLSNNKPAVTPKPVKNNLVCFDMSRNLRINLTEYNIRFDHNIIRFTNGEGEYAIYPPSGWLCSIVKADK